MGSMSGVLNLNVCRLKSSSFIVGIVDSNLFDRFCEGQKIATTGPWSYEVPVCKFLTSKKRT